ncbi:DUF1499 domain-containing protein [Tabrizicola sp. J26]|uniref:DUF1499 domain-containing protein n=1 Tax=Alitabrizicola rongguiensis TaxID=2909234 RepID=UPI001F2AA13A|nr:DUF1499 domain-containing protein [Tabrizicola rongguiensis]MCF1709878.1 DUF1499 domain-containing protein [Tabrizicola rongguiensis]
MTKLGVAAIALVVVVGAFGAYVRLAPSDPAVWHVDPLTAAKPATPNFYLLREGDGDAAPLFLPLPPDQAAAKVQAVAMATPRTQVLAGQGDWVTYVTRSALWGFPDYTSVRVVPAAGGSQVVIFARSRFGKGDLGVNRARVEDWAKRLAQ